MTMKVDHEARVPVDREEYLGEAMLALTPNQRAFVTALLIFGGVKQTEAALAAGYGGNPRSAAVVACRMMRNPRILAAMREEADRRLRSGALLASSALIEIVGDRAHRDRFKAAVELLNRGGLLVETQHRVIVENDSRTTEEIKREVEGMLQRLYKDRPLPVGLLPPIEGVVVGRHDALEEDVVEVVNEDSIDDLMG